MKLLTTLLRSTLFLATLGATATTQTAITAPEGARVAVAYKIPG